MSKVARARVLVGRPWVGGAVGDDGLRRVGDEVCGGVAGVVGVGAGVVGRGGGVTLVLDVGGLCVGVLEGGGGLGAPPVRAPVQPGAGAGGGGADVAGAEGVRDGLYVQQLPAGGLVLPRVVDDPGQGWSAGAVEGDLFAEEPGEAVVVVDRDAFGVGDGGGGIPAPGRPGAFRRGGGPGGVVVVPQHRGGRAGGGVAVGVQHIRGAADEVLLDDLVDAVHVLQRPAGR